MKKITTLFKKDPNDLGRCINEINPENQWVFDGDGIPTRKWDGTACAIIDGELYKRYDVKKGKKVPDGAIPCQEPDAITGHWPHWIKCGDGSEDRWHMEGFENLEYKKDGTYELCGPKVQGNPDNFERHTLVLHGIRQLNGLMHPYTFDNIREYLEQVDMEGIVFHHKQDGRMCKIRKSDYGIKRKKI